MKAISQFVVHVADLVEAEGRVLLTAVRGEARQARSAAASFVAGVAVLLVAVPLVIGGVGLLAAGLLAFLETQMSHSAALCLTGVALLLAALACVAAFVRLLPGAKS